MQQLPSPKAQPKGVVQTKTVSSQQQSFNQIESQCDTFEDSSAGGVQ